MKVQVVLFLISSLHQTEAAVSIYDPQLCYVMDGFLAIYGLIITAMFVNEKFYKTRPKEENVYSDLKGQDMEGYAPLNKDPERGRNRRMADDSTYTDLNRRTDGEYKELPVKKERQRRNEQVYQGLSPATRDTYDSLHLQQVPAR